jgi:hypothetical protein
MLNKYATYIEVNRHESGNNNIATATKILLWCWSHLEGRERLEDNTEMDLRKIHVSWMATASRSCPIVIAKNVHMHFNVLRSGPLCLKLIPRNLSILPFQTDFRFIQVLPDNKTIQHIGLHTPCINAPNHKSEIHAACILRCHKAAGLHIFTFLLPSLF